MMHVRYFSLLVLVAFTSFLFAQPAQPTQVDPFDFGKMWTFEHAPLDYFAETYDFRPEEAWLEKVRMSALRFATFCSASFISPNGLILTNHHCSDGEVIKVMKEGEDFDANGFYARTQAEERRVPDLFVKQLVQIADITDKVKAMTAKAQADEEIAELRDAAFEQIMQAYGEKEDWKGLEMEPVVYYSGGKYSLYGYKRYDDIRLVLFPEQQIGSFGGDPDNFTFPRYGLDFTIWRAYDENGQPVNSSDFYYTVKPEGATAGEVVFAISNPGSTERYRTMAQLEYDRDYRYRTLLAWLSKRMEFMQKENAANPSEQLEKQIISMANSVKAYTGILKGLHDEELMARKQQMEDYIRSRSKLVASGQDPWAELATAYEPLGPAAARNTLLGPSGISGRALVLMHYYAAYVNAVTEEAPAEDQEALRAQVSQLADGLNDPMEVEYLTAVLSELQELIGAEVPFVREALDGRTPAEAARETLEKTKFTDAKKLEKILDAKPKKLEKQKDPLAQLAMILIPEYQSSLEILRSSSAHRRALEQTIGNEVYQIFGLSIPPDATFTLRMTDGVVKGYDYNGTIAPYKTTFFGMYDRFYANGGEYPWSLPGRWQKPPMEMLPEPMNFVSTLDVIGGASGSPVIDAEGQLVGLLFDGNIESLSGNFIYDTRVNRGVSVHAGGIVASMRYIYGADRILEELGLK